MLFHTETIWKSSVVLGDGSFNGCLADLLLFSAVNSLNSFLCLLSWGGRWNPLWLTQLFVFVCSKVTISVRHVGS